MGCYFTIWREEEDEKEVRKSFVLLLASGTVQGEGKEKKEKKDYAGL